MNEPRLAFVAAALGVLMVAAWLAGVALTEELGAESWRAAMRGLWVVLAVLIALCCPWTAASTGPLRAAAVAAAILANAVPGMAVAHLATGVGLTAIAGSLGILVIGAGLLILLALPARSHALLTSLLQITAIVGIFVVREPVFTLVGL